MNMSALDRILLLLTGLLAAYQIIVGIDNLSAVPIWAYSIAFGILLVAGVLMIILGFEVLDSQIVVVVSTVIPLSLSLGLVWQHLPAWQIPYLIFTSFGLLAIVVTRGLPMPGKLQTLILALVHGVAGLLIFLLPIILSATGQMRPGFALVGIGGALIGVGGLLLTFLKAGKPILPREIILKTLPGLLLLMTMAFVGGFTLS